MTLDDCGGDGLCRSRVGYVMCDVCLSYWSEVDDSEVLEE